METTNNEGELAVAVCPQCKRHSVCDPAWIGIGTLDIDCDNCGSECVSHEIATFVRKETSKPS